MKRSVAAVAVGFVVIAVLAIGTSAIVRAALPGMFAPDGRVDAVGLLLGMQLYVFVYAAFGCWLAARLAPDRPMRHALVLGVLGLAFNVAGSAASWGIAPAWYHVLGIALTMPAAWVGGALRERQLARGGAGRLAAV